MAKVESCSNAPTMTSPNDTRPDTLASVQHDRESSCLQGDVENAGNRPVEQQDSGDSESTSEIIVWWSSEDDPDNPMNWSAIRRSVNIGIMALMTFTTYVTEYIYICVLSNIALMETNDWCYARPLASSMLSLGVDRVLSEYHNSNSDLAALVVSIYVLGFAFGPLIFAPLSEIYGRRICYSVSNIFYLVFTITCAVATSIPMLIVVRFLAGSFGATALAIGGGTIADLIPVHKRGLALSFYVLGPVCGPAIGPVIGGFVSAAKGWRWIFWLMSILVCIYIYIYITIDY